MVNNWFKLEMTGDGPDEQPYRPDFKGHESDIDGYSGNETDPNGGPAWLVRVHADASVLDELESDLSGPEKRLDDVPTEALNAMLGQQRDASGWERGFNVGGQS